jgi:hypothetical protein
MIASPSVVALYNPKTKQTKTLTKQVYSYILFALQLLTFMHVHTGIVVSQGIGMMSIRNPVLIKRTDGRIRRSLAGQT